jgi:hypothetical protein
MLAIALIPVSSGVASASLPLFEPRAAWLVLTIALVLCAAAVFAAGLVARRRSRGAEPSPRPATRTRHGRRERPRRLVPAASLSA